MKLVQEKWFEGMDNKDISIDLLRQSETAITEMEKGNKGNAILQANILEEKVRHLRGWICEVKKPAHYGTQLYNFFEEFVFDMNSLVHKTDDKILEIFRANKME